MVEVKARPRFGADGLAATLGLVAPALLSGIWLAPRAASPAEIPPLVLEAAAVRPALAASRALAARAPDDALEQARRTLYLASGRAEARGEDQGVGALRRAELRRAVAEFAHVHGEEGLRAVRARDVERMLPALAGQGDEDARRAEIGAFGTMLERWGAVVDGVRVADELVVRTLFFARWNGIHSLPLDADFSPLEQRAYQGWLALHGEVADGAMRAEALDRFAALDTEAEADAHEARGMLAWQAGEFSLAEAAFSAGYGHTGQIRLRNLAIAAAAAAAGPD